MQNLDLVAVWYLFVFGVLVPFVVIRGSSRGRAGIGVPALKKQAIQIVLMELFFLLALQGDHSGCCRFRPRPGNSAFALEDALDRTKT